jgi:hypothetical protein
MKHDPTTFMSADQTRSAMTEFWAAWLTCQLSVLYHRKKAIAVAKRIRQFDVLSLLLAALAGLGVLAGLKQVPETVWALIAFGSGIVGQLRSIFRLPDTVQEEQTLENEYASVLALLKTFLDGAKHLNGITDDLFADFQRVRDRFNTLTIERDKTDYNKKDTNPLFDEVLEQFPQDRQWMPDYARM